MANTDISFFWAWMDSYVEHYSGKRAPIHAAGSMYCEQLEGMQDGSANTFGVPMSPEYSRILMNSSEQNRHEILKAVNCTRADDFFYPLSFEDSINAISTPPALVQLK